MHQLNLVNKSYCLHQVCESNYFKLLKLVPGLLTMHRQATATITGKPPLTIKIIERSPYTVTFELSYFFDYPLGSLSEPALRIRAYLDAKSVEVIRRHYPHIQRPTQTSNAHKELMRYKWKLNYFLEKWLCHCLRIGYRFKQKENAETALP